MKSRFHEAADAELSEALAYYDGKAAGLGDRFLAEVKAATRYIQQYPAHDALSRKRIARSHKRGALSRKHDTLSRKRDTF